MVVFLCRVAFRCARVFMCVFGLEFCRAPVLNSFPPFVCNAMGLFCKVSEGVSRFKHVSSFSPQCAVNAREI